MRLPMASRIHARAASIRLATILLVLISAAYASASRPLPPPVVSKAPGIHPLGKGRHTWFGVRMYDATLWIVGPQWSAAAPQALDIEPGRDVPADTLIKNAIAEMRDLKVGDEGKLASLAGGNEDRHSQCPAGRPDRHLLPGHQPDDWLLERIEDRRDKRSVILPGDHERVASSANQASVDAEIATAAVNDSRRAAGLISEMVSTWLRCGFLNSTTICPKN